MSRCCNWQSFPFSNLHSNAGARLKSEILLLPSTLLNPEVASRGIQENGYMFNSPPVEFNIFDEQVTEQGEEGEQNSYAAHDTENPDDGGNDFSVASDAENSTNASGSAENSTNAGGSEPAANTHGAENENSATAAGSTTAEPANGSGGGESASRSSSSTAAGSSFTANQSVDDSVQVQQQQTRPTTRLQRGIRKEKVYTDGTVRYSFLASSSEEPQSLNEALADSNWKQAMDTEFTALIHNKTWHLVPP